MVQTYEKEGNLNRILFELMQESVNISSRHDLYQLILESAIKAIPASQKGSIMLLDPETNLLHFVAAKGYDYNVLKTTYLRLDQSFLYRESKGKIEHTIVIHDPFEYDRKRLNDENIDVILSANSEDVMTSLSTPLIVDDTLYGMLNIDSSFEDAYNEEDRRIIEMFAFEVINVLKLFNSMEKTNYFMDHDYLTGTYNRRYFIDVFTHKLNRATKQKTPLSLITFKLHELKHLNAYEGYECGDKLLIEFAFGLKRLADKDGIVCKSSGSEFHVILPGYDALKCQELVSKLKNYLLLHPLSLNQKTIPIQFLYSIVNYPDEKRTIRGFYPKRPSSCSSKRTCSSQPIQA